MSRIDFLYSNILCLSLLTESEVASKLLNEPQLRAQLPADTQKHVSRPHKDEVAVFIGCTRDTWQIPTAQKRCFPRATTGSSFGDRLMESHYAFWLRSLLFVVVVWEHRACSPRQRKTVISALCSLCCTSDSPFSHFLAFIHFNSSASWAISLAILLCSVSRSLLYLLIPLWLVKLNEILKK